ncbi:MAG: FHA domain-containing protein, partial [Myxococcota bacterium]
MPRLRFRGADGKEMTVDINQDLHEVTIGRNPGNVIRIANPSISRQHAKILFDGGKCTIFDLNSSNGSFVNGKKIRSQVLHHNDRIRCGEFPLEFLDDEEESQASPLSPVSSAPPSISPPPQPPVGTPASTSPPPPMAPPPGPPASSGLSGAAPALGHSSSAGLPPGPSGSTIPKPNPISGSLGNTPGLGGQRRSTLMGGFSAPPSSGQLPQPPSSRPSSGAIPPPSAFPPSSGLSSRPGP